MYTYIYIYTYSCIHTYIYIYIYIYIIHIFVAAPVAIDVHERGGGARLRAGGLAEGGTAGARTHARTTR